MNRRGLPKDKLNGVLGLLCLTGLACLLPPDFAFAQHVTQKLTSRIEGTVIDQTGAPISNAEVSFHAPSFNARVVTGNSGEFSISEVAATSGKILVRAKGFAPFEQSWTAQQGNQQLRIVLAVQPLTEKVTITAARTETANDDTAAAINVLTSAELSQSASVTIDDALRQVPGFQLFRRSGSRTANPTSQGVSLRGVGASGASRALVLVDGVTLNDPFGGWVYWSRVPRDSVERIEVVSGGSSSLYGSSALGGVVQIVSRVPAGRVVSFETSYGSQTTPDATLFMSDRRGDWSGAFVAEVFGSKGYIPVAKEQRGTIDTRAGSRHSTVDFRVERYLSEVNRVFLRGAIFGESRTNGTPLQSNRTHFRQLSGGGEWLTKSFGSFNARAHAETQLLDQNFSAVAPDRNSESLIRLQRVPVQSFGLSGQWSRAFRNDVHRVVAGGELRSVRGSSDEIAYAQGRPTALVSNGGNELSSGAFVEEIFRPVARLILTGSARFDRWRNHRGYSQTRSLASNALSSNSFPDRVETAFSPYLSAVYHFNRTASVVASAYRAFRQPTLNELYRSFRVGDVLTLANENLQAERLTGGEVGTRLRTWNDALHIQATLFWSEIKDPIANATLQSTPTLITRQRQNLGRTRSRGLELESELIVANKWVLSGGYLFADARVLRFPGNTALEGLLVPQVPCHQFSFQVRYANDRLFDFGLQGRASSAQFDDDQNRFPLDRYFLLDARVSRKLGRSFELFVAAENLLNHRYQIGRTPVLTLASPAFFRLGLKVRFDSESGK